MNQTCDWTSRMEGVDDSVSGTVMNRWYGHLISRRSKTSRRDSARAHCLTCSRHKCTIRPSKGIDPQTDRRITSVVKQIDIWNGHVVNRRISSSQFSSDWFDARRTRAEPSRTDLVHRRIVAGSFADVFPLISHFGRFDIVMVFGRTNRRLFGNRTNRPKPIENLLINAIESSTTWVSSRDEPFSN